VRLAGVVAAAVAVAVCLTMLVTSLRARATPGAATQSPSATARLATARLATARLATARLARSERSQRATALASCERGLRSRRPVMVVVGASFTAGVGPGSPDLSWAAMLARTLHWNAVVYGVAGAGYIRPGVGRKGPVEAEIAAVDLRSLDPALVIVQAGHDDIGVPARLERRRVAQTVSLIHAEAPSARIALLTVFPGRSSMAAAYRTDRAIVAAGTGADRSVIVMDPLAGHWPYQRSADGLHPTMAGSEWLAAKVAGILRQHGVLAAAADGQVRAALCDYGVAYPVGSRSRISVPPPAADSARTEPP
jgi:acyl-CoA thioesterase I